MVEASALVFAVNQKVDRLNTESKVAKNIVSICWALTEALQYIIKERVQKHEMDKRYRHELGALEVKDKYVLAHKGGIVTEIRYPDDLYRDLNIRVAAVKRGCGKKMIELTKMSTQSRGRSLNNPFWTSSYAWEQCFGDEAGGVVYIDNGADFKVEGMWIDYIKKHPPIHSPKLVRPPDQYVDWNGEVQTKESGLLVDEIRDDVINMASLILTRNIGDPRDFQLQSGMNTVIEQQSKF